MCESLFQEHWRRFVLAPPQAVYPLDAVISGALYQNDQLLWSLGVIPWRAWRLPFQKAMLGYLHKHCLHPQTADQLYDIIATALATAHGHYFASPSENDRKNLCTTLRSFIPDSGTANKLIEHIHSIAHEKNASGSLLNEHGTGCSSDNKIERLTNSANSVSILLHFRVINEFLKQCLGLFPTLSDQFKIVIAMFSIDALAVAPLEAPNFFTTKRILADTSKISPEVHKFWTWQYTCRNEEYKKLRDVFTEVFRDKNTHSASTPLRTRIHKMYEGMISERNERQNARKAVVSQRLDRRTMGGN